MAAAFFNQVADPAKAQAFSAGTQPGTQVHPVVFTAMQAVGIDLSGAQPQFLSAEMLKNCQFLITMGCGESCPVAPVSVQKLDWPFEDPKGKPMEQVEIIRDAIQAQVRQFVQTQGWG
jgi:arsenate reductase